MLTGDKIETATSIAISAGLKSRRHQLHFMREIKEESQIKLHLKEFNTKSKNTVLIIDGTSLNTILNSNILK